MIGCLNAAFHSLGSTHAIPSRPYGMITGYRIYVSERQRDNDVLQFQSTE